LAKFVKKYNNVDNVEELEVDTTTSFAEIVVDGCVVKELLSEANE